MMDLRLLPIKHEHYCETCDKRWTCDRKPCLLHHAELCLAHLLSVLKGGIRGPNASRTPVSGNGHLTMDGTLLDSC